MSQTIHKVRFWQNRHTNVCMCLTLNISKFIYKVRSHLPVSQDSFLVKAPDSWSKGCKFKSRQGQQGNFLLQSQLCMLTLIQCPFHPTLLQWHVKEHSHSAKSAGGRLHLNTHTPLTHRSQSGLTMLLSRQSVGIYQETSSHASHQGTLGYSRLGLLSHCGLILA